MSRRPAHFGLTLIETLVATALVGLILSMVYGSYAATTKSLRHYDDRAALTKRADLILRLMVRQIRSAYAPPADPNRDRPIDSGVPTGATATRASLGEPSEAFRGTGANPKGPFLAFLTAAGVGNAPTISWVAYRHDPVECTLSIRQHPWLSPQSDPSRPRWLPILNRVADITLEFHDGQSWQTQWDSRRSGALPRAVRITLGLTDEQGRRYETGTTAFVGQTAVRADASTSRQIAGVP